jgi:hypothetical protein
VVDLTERLRPDGVDGVLDRSHMREGHEPDVFMNRTVNDPAIGS